MSEEISLRGLVLSKFRSINEFAREIGWSRNKAVRIIDRVQEPTGSEMTQIAELLGLKQEVFMQIFFTDLFTLWTINQKAG